jgi:hypothetical protein
MEEHEPDGRERGGDEPAGFPRQRTYDEAAEHPERYAGHEREHLDDDDLADIARKHLAHIHLPHLPIPGLSTIEKKLIFFICDHTGAPNPFHTLERLTGDCVELERAEQAWARAQDQAEAAVALIRGATLPYGPAPEGAAAGFARALEGYLTELDELAASLGTTRDCLKAIRNEAQLAENTILMLINLLVGSLGGLLVAEFVTAGTVTPVAAAQAQVELAYVGKKIAFIAGKLHLLYADAVKILAVVRGFRGIDAAHFVFEAIPEVTGL